MYVCMNIYIYGCICIYKYIKFPKTHFNFLNNLISIIIHKHNTSISY